MPNWLQRNAEALQALGGIATSVIALAALIGVKWQIDATFDTQREQSARDIYREFLSLSIVNPDLARPDYCALKTSPKVVAYESYVEYMLYAAEQSLDMDPEFRGVFLIQFANHGQYLCQEPELKEYTAPVASLIAEFRNNACPAINPCP